MCRSITSYAFPKRVLNKKGVYKTVAADPNTKLVEAVRVSCFSKPRSVTLIYRMQEKANARLREPPDSLWARGGASSRNLAFAFACMSYLPIMKVEKCLHPERSCQLGDGKEFSDYGIRTVCRQQYSYQKLLAVSSNGEEEVDLFRFPSGCKCFRIN